MGSLEVLGYDSVFSLFPVVLSGVLIIAILRHELDLLTTGDDLATSRGVAVKKVRAILFLVTSLMVGGVVAVCGPIGFVGMMAPHICRLLTGWNHRYLLPATFLFGGAFLTICDTFARTLIAPVEIPVGIITALLGGPFFIWLLLSSPFTSSFNR
jgi:iron complex transport system permease protein